MSLILSGTDGLSDVDGTAATPAIRGTDANTGIFFPAADTIAFAEGGAEVARFDSSGNLGLGVTPSAWGAGTSVIDLATSGNAGAVSASGTLSIAKNGFFNGTNWIYKNTSSAMLYQLISSEHRWSNAASGTAGNAITFTQAMTLDANGNQLLGVTSNTNANNRLYVVGPLASYTSSATTLATSATSASVRLSFAQDSSQSIFMGMATDGTNYPSYIQAANGGGTTASNLTLQPFGGDLLVGTTSSTNLQNNNSFLTGGNLPGAGSACFNGTNGNTVLQVNQTLDDNAARGQIYFYRNESLIGSITSSNTTTHLTICLTTV